MSAVEPPIATPTYRDQSNGLIVFGVFQVLIGCLCGLMVPLMMFGAAMQRSMPAGAGAMDLRQMIPNVALYLALAVGGIWLGVGSIKARRWAWALTIVLSWLWLIGGVVALIFLSFTARNMFAALERQANVSPQGLMLIKIFIGAIFVILYVGLPTAFLLFYHREAVRVTCQWRNPEACWTDRCPLPVLAVSIVLGYSALWIPLMLVYNCVVPFFGVFLSGLPGATVILLMALLLGFLAWGVYRLKMAAWWGTVALCIVAPCSAALTFLQVDILQMYEKMGFSKAHLDAMLNMGLIESLGGLVWMMPIFAILMLGYLVWVRRYFY